LSPQLEVLEISLKLIVNNPHCKVDAKEEILLLLLILHGRSSHKWKGTFLTCIYSNFEDPNMKGNLT